jgi:D-ribose pyranose/furanose isomerase RbsD
MSKQNDAVKKLEKELKELDLSGIPGLAGFLQTMTGTVKDLVKENERLRKTVKEHAEDLEDLEDRITDIEIGIETFFDVLQEEISDEEDEDEDSGDEPFQDDEEE